MVDLSSCLPPRQYHPFRETLDAPGRAAYNAVLHGALRYESRIRLPVSIDGQLAEALCRALAEQVPEFAFVNGFVLSYVNGMRVDAVYPQYACDSGCAERLLRAMEEEAASVLAQAVSLGRVAQIRLFHDWIRNRYEYESGDLSQPYAHIAAGVMLFGRSVCEGVAKAMKYLCDRAGIKSLVVAGWAGEYAVSSVARDDSLHAWNIVDFAEPASRQPQWCHVDVTWDRQFPQHVPCLAYFGLSDAQMSPDHELMREPYYPRCPRPVEYHRSIGRLARDATDVRRIVRQAAQAGDRVASFQCEGPAGLAAERPQRKLLDSFRRIAHRELTEAGVAHQELCIWPDYDHLVFTIEWK